MSKLIYVADDEKNICFLIENFLEKEGYEVECFGEGDSRNFKRILEGEEHAELCTLVSGFFRDVLASEEDLTVCHMIVRVPHQGAAECGFSGTVRSHEYVGLAFVDR